MSDFSGMGIGKGLGLLALAAALVVLADAVKKISEINVASLVKGLGGIAVMLGEIALFTKLTSDTKGIISTALGLTILGTAMLIFAQAIIKMGSMSLEQIGKGLLTLAGSLTIIIVALKKMPQNITSQAAGLLVMSAGLLVLSKALSSIGVS